MDALVSMWTLTHASFSLTNTFHAVTGFLGALLPCCRCRRRPPWAAEIRGGAPCDALLASSSEQSRGCKIEVDATRLPRGSTVEQSHASRATSGCAPEENKPTGSPPPNAPPLCAGAAADPAAATAPGPASVGCGVDDIIFVVVVVTVVMILPSASVDVLVVTAVVVDPDVALL